MKFAFHLVAIIYACLHLANGILKVQPEQVHISYGAKPCEMMITWVTVDKTRSSQVEYGEGRITKMATGNRTLFVDGGPQKRSMYIHRVLLSDLNPGARYVYHCGSPDGWSSLHWFTAMKEGTDFQPSFAVYGDLGNENAVSLPRLQKEVQQNMYDAVLHVGDFAYNMDTDNARVGDEFMRQIQPIAAYVPYMTAVGNHEQKYNFSNYNNRFSMVNLNGKMNNYFYSFNIGPAHIIVFSTEFYYYLIYGKAQVHHQYQWLEEDLKEANEPANRAQRPWIITTGHRPMYCSADDGDDCTKKESIVYVVFRASVMNEVASSTYFPEIRKGLPGVYLYGLEDLFYKYGVDLEIWAHEHNYERLWPIYDFKIFNGSDSSPYTNPKAPVHVITGSAGCNGKHDPFLPVKPSWSAFRNSDYGYSRMKIYNGTHVHFQQVSDDQGGAVVDDFWIIKEKHGPEAWLKKPK